MDQAAVQQAAVLASHTCTVCAMCGTRGLTACIGNHAHNKKLKQINYTNN